MNNTRSYFFVFSLIFFVTQSSAQELSTQDIHNVGSLQNEFKATKHDTARLRHFFKIGVKTSLNRRSYWDSLLLLSIKYNSLQYQCQAFIFIAVACKNQNDLENAITYGLKGIAIGEKNGFDSELVYLFLNLSIYYEAQNNVKKSLDYSYKLLKVAEKLNRKEHIELAYSNLSRSYFLMGDYEKALNISLLSLKRAKGGNNPQLIAKSLLDIGGVYCNQKKYYNSIDYYRQTAKYIAKVDSACVIEIYNSLGSAFEQEYLINNQQDFSLLDSAYNFYLRASKIAKSTNDYLRNVSCLSLMGNINFQRGKLELAEKQTLEGLKLAREIGFYAEISRAGLLLKKIYEKQERYKEALKAQELHLSVRDSLANDNNLKLAMQKEFDYNLEKKENENKLLAQQNQIKSLQLAQNKYLVIGLTSVLVLVVLFGFLFLRQNKLRAEQINTQLEQKLLLTQMNPHFIFNSLQAIQNFILKNNKEEADSFLSSFAIVVRNVLENSRVESISLNKEIKLLTHYLQLQKLRFKNRFEYEIKVDETIDAENILIPPMLAQPFIENAVEHGFYGIEGGGKIEVYYFVKNNALFMKIIDNGGGMKDNYSESKQHRSLAIDITKDRVTLINSKAKQKAFFTISEAFPLQTERRGVRVDFTLPLQLQT